MAAGKDASATASLNPPSKTSSVTVQGDEATLKAIKSVIRIDSKSTVAPPWKLVKDFDDHLEDTTADWLLNKQAMAGLSSLPALKV